MCRGQLSCIWLEYPEIRLTWVNVKVLSHSLMKTLIRFPPVSARYTYLEHVARIAYILSNITYLQTFNVKQHSWLWVYESIMVTKK